MVRKESKYFKITVCCVFLSCALILAGCKPKKTGEPGDKARSEKKTGQLTKKQSQESKMEVVDANPYYVEIMGWLRVPLVVENLGNSDVYDVTVVATAYNAEGKILGTVSSDDKYRLAAPPEKVNPSRIEPGGKGYGVLCLGNIKDYTGIRFQVSAADKSVSFKEKELVIVEHSMMEEEYQSGKGAGKKKTVLGTVKNETNERVSNVIISVAGFDKAGKIVDLAEDKAEIDEISPGSTSPFSIDFEENRPIEEYKIVAVEANDDSK